MIRRRTPYPTGAGGTGTPSYTASTFSALPAAATSGQRCTVTGETGLSGLVCVNTGANTWEVETVTASDTLIGDVEWGATPGQWYSSGGVVVTTQAGATALDSTNLRAWRWDATNTQFVNPRVYAGTIAGVAKVKGDSAAPSGWTVTDTDGSGTASITTSAGAVLLSVTTSTAFVATTASLVLADASLSSAGNAYVRGYIYASTLSGNQASVRVSIFDGTDVYEFGDSITGAAPTSTGQFYNPASGNIAYTAQSGAQLGIRSALTLVEIMKVGARCSVSVGGGLPIDVIGATVRDSATKQWAITATTVPAAAVASTAVLQINRLSVMRF